MRMTNIDEQKMRTTIFMLSMITKTIVKTTMTTVTMTSMPVNYVELINSSADYIAIYILYIYYIYCQKMIQ